jgi:hypothetical protein
LALLEPLLRALFTGALEFLAAGGALRRRQTAKLTRLLPAQRAFLPLDLPRRLCVRLRGAL